MTTETLVTPKIDFTDSLFVIGAAVFTSLLTEGKPY